MAVDGLRHHVQIVEVTPLVKLQPQVQAKENLVGMKHQLVRWVVVLRCLHLVESHQKAHQQWLWQRQHQVNYLYYIANTLI